VHRALLLSTLVLAACACSKASSHTDDGPESEAKPPRQPVKARVHITGADGEDHAVDVEVVRSEAEVRKGLMWRKQLDADAGMLFFMGEVDVHTFWMKNTYISLDMIFITEDMHVAGIVENTPPLNEEQQYVDTPSLYVLEVNAGWSKKHQVGAGARVSFENIKM
jgi:uncharacterized membrane protein (UPF0127 family)